MEVAMESYGIFLYFTSIFQQFLGHYFAYKSLKQCPIDFPLGI